MSGPNVIDMAVLRSKLAAAQALLRDGEIAGVAALIDESLEMLFPKLDADRVYPAVSQDAVTQAIQAAHDVLIAVGVENPVEILIVQAHDASGHTTGRTLASSAANPQDLLRLCLENVRDAQPPPGGRRGM